VQVLRLYFASAGRALELQVTCITAQRIPTFFGRDWRKFGARGRLVPKEGCTQWKLESRDRLEPVEGNWPSTGSNLPRTSTFLALQTCSLGKILYEYEGNRMCACCTPRHAWTKCTDTCSLTHATFTPQLSLQPWPQMQRPTKHPCQLQARWGQGESKQFNASVENAPSLLPVPQSAVIIHVCVRDVCLRA